MPKTVHEPRELHKPDQNINRLLTPVITNRYCLHKLIEETKLFILEYLNIMRSWCCVQGMWLALGDAISVHLPARDSLQLTILMLEEME